MLATRAKRGGSGGERHYERGEQSLLLCARCADSILIKLMIMYITKEIFEQLLTTVETISF